MIKLLVVLDILIAIFFGLSYKFMPEQIPLFYSRSWGELQIANLWYILLLPLLMNLFFFLNNFIVKKFFPNDQTIKKLVSYANVFMMFSFFGIYIKIVLLVS